MLSKGKGIALFTDGSASSIDRSGGWAFVAIDHFGNEEVGSGYVSDTTVNRMEQQAWIEGLDYIAETLGPCDVLVYSDSQYVVLGAKDKRRKRKVNLDLWDELDEAMDQHTYVECKWVRGHSVSYYNQLADELAGQARKEGLNES